MNCCIFPSNQEELQDQYQLTERHQQEWVVDSAVSPTLTTLNVRSLTGIVIYEYLVYALPQTARRNDGRLRDKYLYKYAHACRGGWWVSGLDPRNNWEPMEWGRFKPDYPRWGWDKITKKQTDKPVKYESPINTPNRVTYLRVPLEIWEMVAHRYNVPMPEEIVTTVDGEAIGFWAWVVNHPQIPIILTEGEKKAACLLSLGFVAISLPGIWNGRVGKSDFNEKLHPDLMPVAKPGRKFIILFDYETKPKTRWAVFQATIRTGQAIEAVSCFCEVALLPESEKGVDDFVVSINNALAQENESNLEEEASLNFSSHSPSEGANTVLTAIIEDAKPLRNYQRSFHCRSRGLSNKYKPHLEVNVKYLSEAVRLPESGFVVLSSDMGTGKTEMMQCWRNEHPHERFLNNGHRVNLLRNLAQRLNTQMYSDLSNRELTKATALSITIDSLHKLNTQALTYGCVFIDEACQYLTHLLHSKTCKENRATILEVLQYIVYSARLVVIADAHMDDVTVNFFRAMRPKDEEPLVIKNHWKDGSRPIYWYEGNDSSALVAQISAALMVGQKIMVASDSKKFIKKLEKSLNVSVKVDDSKAQNSYRQLKVWSIHSDNSESKENVVFIKDIRNAVKNVDAFLTSPSLGTGVDLPDYHFDLVFGVFHGISQTATECAQHLHRYRPKVPMHVWVAPRPRFGYAETNATKIKEQLLQTNEMTAFLLRIDTETGKRGVEKDWALQAYCDIQAQRNKSMNHLRTDLLDLLTKMGNKIIPMGTERNELAQKRLKDAAVALDTAYYSAVAGAKDISASEYRKRMGKNYLKPEEIYECEKFRIQEAYGMEVTPSLVEKDNDGKLIRAISNLEAILAESDGVIEDTKTGRIYPAPPEIVAEKDRQERNKLPLCMDWGNYSARWVLLSSLGLPEIVKRLIDGEEVTATDPELLRIVEIAKQCAVHVKAILGFTIPSKCQPIWLLALLLDQLGLKLTSRKQGSRGQQVKFHFLSQEELEFAKAVIDYRERKRPHNVKYKNNPTASFSATRGAIIKKYSYDTRFRKLNKPQFSSLTETAPDLEEL
ncbi:DUF3854 domain-containing protein [Scytonema tolypothrichoides VB-61278]|nr:DUF3854 domain-containing protein [Scytonema tolypothrichoides VB-61278]